MDGTTQPIEPADIDLAELERTRVAGRQIPVSWRLRIEGRELDLNLSALNRQAWMGTSIPYWEGPVRLQGSHAGTGYLEMTGY